MRNLRPRFQSPSLVKQKQKKKKQVALVAGISVLLIGTSLLTAKYGGNVAQWTGDLFQKQASSTYKGDQKDLALAPLVSLSPKQRATKLEAIAQYGKSPDQERARYLLASDLLQQKQGEKALEWLNGLETKYPVLGAKILSKRAQAYEITGDKAKAKASWQNLLKTHPTSPVAAEALFALGKSDPKYGEQAIAKFPSHPRTLELVRQKLKQTPNQTQLLLILVKYAPDQPGIVSLLDRLVAQDAQELKQSDWDAIASIYWHKRDYLKASNAYLKATNTPLNAYRFARGLDLSGKKSEAQSAYQFLLSEFPQAQETGNSLLNLARLSESNVALTYLEQVINKFPQQAGEALLEKAKILSHINNPQSASQPKQLLLTKYGSSEEAAEYRWKMAQQSAAAKDFASALNWAKQITAQSPNSQFAYRASFWSGKWAFQLGRKDEAKAAFEHTIANYPQSYYSWRSAVFLGWDVGDFNKLRQLNPEVVLPKERPALPAGSDTVKELYLIGQDQDAWTLWQAEFQNRVAPTVAEQFADGLMRIAMGDYRLGIDQVSRLEDRETPEEKAHYQAFKQEPAYWQALYPLPFSEIIEQWAQQRQLNPLLVTGLIRQESRFESDIRSSAGATGLMQVMPATSSWVAQKINLKNYKLENPADNIQIGTWYLDHTHESYQNNSLLAIASYNAGPGNVSKWLREKAITDPDEFVEAIPFEETNWYVKNVFGNYWNYLRLYNPKVAELVNKYAATAQKS